MGEEEKGSLTGALTYRKKTRSLRGSMTKLFQGKEALFTPDEVKKATTLRGEDVKKLRESMKLEPPKSQFKRGVISREKRQSLEGDTPQDMLRALEEVRAGVSKANAKQNTSKKTPQQKIIIAGHRNKGPSI